MAIAMACFTAAVLIFILGSLGALVSIAPLTVKFGLLVVMGLIGVGGASLINAMYKDFKEF